MRKRLVPRPDPMEEGVLAQISELLIRPLTKVWPKAMDKKQWLEEHVFCIKTRDITRYKVHTPFRMPGYFLAAPLLPIQGLGYRDVKKGTILIVAEDSTTPDKVVVEYFGGRGEADQLFQLTGSEWGWVKLHVNEAERKKK